MEYNNFLTLINDNGDRVEISMTEHAYNQAMTSFREAQEQNNYWFVGILEGVQCTFKGIELAEVNMRRIVGVMHG